MSSTVGQPDATTRIADLLAAMTLEEKIGQLTMLTAEIVATGPRVSADYMTAIRAGRLGNLSNLRGVERTREVQRVAIEEARLGIPLLFAADVIHGHQTIFPIPLGEAAAFDPGLWERTARAAADEATADGLILAFAPMLDVARDPRWGRIAESPGEDPYLASRFAEAKVRGFQGSDLTAAHSLAATAKHLAGYGAVTAGREYASIDMSELTLHEVYLPPFQAAASAGAAAIMAAFVDLAGVPMSANAAILRHLVRDQWGFAGVIVSDYAAVAELVPHGVAEDLADAAALALRAGIDIDLNGEAYSRGLPIALQRGSVAMAEIDAAVHRVLDLKSRLGLFDDPYRRGRHFADRGTYRALARDAARRSIVLLTNRGNLLPLRPGLRRLALIGPLADTKREMLGPAAANGFAEDAVAFLDGLRRALPGCDVTCAQGVAIDGDDTSDLAAALDLARTAELVVLCLGESPAMSGEAASRVRLGLPGQQRHLAQSVLELGKPVVVLLSSGRPLTVPWLFERADAVLAAWFLGSEAGHAVGDVLTGRSNPAGRLPISWPVDVGQVPICYAQRPTGRPANAMLSYTSKYIDLPVEPLFPFGHGLSYTRFVFGDLRVHPAELRPGEQLTIEVEVTNAGDVEGEETVLLFLRDPVASTTRPLLELKGFAKVTIRPGRRETVRFALATDALAFLGPDLVPRLEPGVFEIFVGPSAARDVLLKATVRLGDTASGYRTDVPASKL
ncbi:MAG: glycoside hydrolase family 3 N-terminal domain-containing protein [Dongiaceae bacterium]